MARFWGFEWAAGLGAAALVGAIVSACTEGGDEPLALVRAVPTEAVKTKPAAAPEAPAARGARQQPVRQVAHAAAPRKPARSPSVAPPQAKPAAPLTLKVELHDEAGALLPQTRDLPESSPLLKRRVEALWQAIVQNDAALARDFFFPLEAYEKVKRSKNPRRDYERRLLKLYQRDIERWHDRLGKGRGKARLLGLEIEDRKARWMKPGSEHNRVGYWRLLRSNLRYLDDRGRTRRFEVTSLISWRGEWYVVHLDGFK